MTQIPQKQHWMRLLALASTPLLEEHYSTLTPVPEHTLLKQPEVGIAMIQARTCGNGAPFNFGEIPLTRCAVQLGEHIGYGYVSGRKKRHALLMAIYDALLQDERRRPELERGLLATITTALAEKKAQKAKETATTKVDFFTLVRGEDEQ